MKVLPFYLITFLLSILISFIIPSFTGRVVVITDKTSHDVVRYVQIYALEVFVDDDLKFTMPLWYSIAAVLKYCSFSVSFSIRKFNNFYLKIFFDNS